jgi:predicted phosphodiesterase
MEVFVVTHAQQGDVWGLISDVHGNLSALEEALRVLEAARASRLAFLGDYLGRGDAEACVQLIRQTGEVAIVGNRDLDWQNRVSADAKAWVLGLPRAARIGPLLLTHGDARLTPALCTAQIARDFLAAWREMEQARAQVWAFGHSHFARTWRKDHVDRAAEQIGTPDVGIDPAYRYFVNVGTTGLPFAGKGGPSVVLVDFFRAELRHLPLASPGLLNTRSPQPP